VIIAKVRSGIEEVRMNVEEWGPILLLFVGVKHGTEAVNALTPETVKARTFEMLRQLSLAGSRRRPLVLAIEDLHWIDKTSEEYLSSLVENLSGAPILLVSTYRPGYRPDWLEKSFATQILLRPLSSSDSLRVIYSVAEPQTLPESLAQIIVQKAEGNPLFLEELAKTVDDRTAGSQSISNARYGSGRVAGAHRPAGRLLQTASVIGREAPLKLLRTVWDTPGNLDVHLLELKRQEFLYERSTSGEQVLVFKHALTQDVAYDSLLSPMRQALHDATARAIELIYENQLQEHYELLAHHYSHAAKSEKALNYLALASQKAAKANAMKEAVTHFGRSMALDTMPDTDTNRRRRLSLILDQWIAFWLLFRVAEYLDLLKKHHDTAAKLSETNLLTRFQLYVGHCQWVFGLFDQAAETLLQAVRQPAGSDADIGAAYITLQWTDFYLGNFEQALSWQEPALHRLRQRGDPRWHSWSLAAGSWACSCLGRVDEAIAQAHEEIRVAEEYNDSSLISFAYWIAAIAHTYIKMISTPRSGTAKYLSKKRLPQLIKCGRKAS
jgi:tetratricopeptide (TPR) repeat protein